MSDDLDKLVEECDYETKLAITRWVLKHVADHGREGGSYRYFIYSRLDFDTDAYSILLDDGMFITNEFDVGMMALVREKVAEYKLDVLKPVVGLCDEPDCYNLITCGFPTDDGKYRKTCGKHYIQYRKKD